LFLFDVVFEFLFQLQFSSVPVFLRHNKELDL